MSRGIAFLREGDMKEDALRYAELCNLIRPPPLKLPASSPPATGLLLRKMLVVNTSNVSTPTSSEEGDERDSESENVSQAPSSDGETDNARLILHCSSMQVPEPFVIPEYRVRTPRTPRTPRAESYAGRPVSPIDEVCRMNNTTPKAMLIHRYKAMTPKASDFAFN